MVVNTRAVIALKNGKKIVTQSETIDEVCTLAITHHHGWARVTLANGMPAQIWAEEIAYVYEEVGE